MAQLLEKMGWEPQDEGQRAVALVGANDWAAAVALGPPAVDPLIKVLQDKSSTWRRDAAQALGEIGDARAVGPLLVALGEVGESGVDGVFAKLSVRGAAARALVGIGDPRAVESLVAALADANESVRKDAVEALGRIGDPRALEPLVAMLTDADEGVRGAAVEALESMGWEPPERANACCGCLAARGEWRLWWRWGPRGWIPCWPPLKARRAGCEGMQLWRWAGSEMPVPWGLCCRRCTTATPR